MLSGEFDGEGMEERQIVTSLEFSVILLNKNQLFFFYSHNSKKLCKNKRNNNDNIC